MIFARILAALLLMILGSYSHAQSATKRIIHVFVALADNENQGIVPVPAKLGNGQDPARNLYWGAAGGVKTFFIRSTEWALLNCTANPKPDVLERCVFKHRKADVFLVADAYRGIAIRQTILDFLSAAAGETSETITLPTVTLNIAGGSNLVAYVGHDGLMDFQLSHIPVSKNKIHRDAIILACASKQYFGESLKATGAYLLLLTTNLMAPEAYTLRSAIDGWIAGETNPQIRERAAVAYDHYQKCGLRGARRLFATGW